VNDETRKTPGRDKPEFKRLGLHFCKRYRNLVRYDPDFCGACPFNGLRDEG